MKLQLTHRKPEVANVESFIFQPTAAITWKAGQFLHYVLHHEPTDDRGSDRWFTISSAPFEEHIMVTTRFNEEKSSSFKSKLKNLKIGNSIEITDVEGDFTLDDENAEYIFIAGGIGITPFRSILSQLQQEGKTVKVTLLYSNRDESPVYKEELEQLAVKNSQLKIYYIISPEHIDETKIRQFVPDLQKPFFFISGPEPMVESLGNLLKTLAVPQEHIKQDWFPGYPAE